MWRRPLFGLLVCASILCAEQNAPKEGTYYTVGKLGVKKIDLVGNNLDITFKPMDEQFHWCPGIKIKKTDKATVVTFVRCKTSKSCSTDKQASIEKHMIRKISIPTNSKDVYLRNGPGKFKQIYKSPNSTSKPGESPESKTKKTTTKKTTKKKSTKKKTTKKKSGSGNRRPAILRPAEDFVPRDKGRVKNSHSS